MIAVLYSRGPNPARLNGNAAKRNMIGTIMRHWATEILTLVALRQRKKDTAKKICDETEAKTVIFFLLLSSRRLTAFSSVFDFEKKILILRHLARYYFCKNHPTREFLNYSNDKILQFSTLSLPIIL